MTGENALAYQSTKTYGHNLGFSAAFRQYKADSHCHFIHGYALSVKLVFEADELDHRNWVVDFGGLKPIKKWLEDTFDHKTLVALDDPELDWFIESDRRGVIDIVVVEAVGCEKFAEMVYRKVAAWVADNYGDRVRLVSAEVAEHGANSAVVTRDQFEVKPMAGFADIFNSAEMMFRDAMGKRVH
jgi:6-pyruvoyltetrahydropterin/6-carboxytetrahydropterin synthase